MTHYAHMTDQGPIYSDAQNDMLQHWQPHWQLWEANELSIKWPQSSSWFFCHYGACWVCLCFHNPLKSDMDHMDGWPYHARLCMLTVGHFSGVKILCRLYTPQKFFGGDYKLRTLWSMTEDSNFASVTDNIGMTMTMWSDDRRHLASTTDNTDMTVSMTLWSDDRRLTLHQLLIILTWLWQCDEKTLCISH